MMVNVQAVVTELLLLLVITAASSSESSPPLPTPAVAMMQPYTLSSARCLAGEPAVVYANATIKARGTAWVISLGSTSAGRPGFCIDEDHCGMVGAACPGHNPGCPANPLHPPPPPPAPVALAAGIQSGNCTENPDFCAFNQAMLSDCDQALLFSDAEVPTLCRNASDQLLPINGSSCTLFFHGQRIIAQSLQRLAGLGMASAETVVLTGFSHGGTMALLHADRIHALLKVIAPNLKKFGTIPADGVHPRSRWGVVDWFPQICCAPYCNSSRVCSNTLDLLYQGMANVSNASAALAPACTARFPREKWRCLYVNESLPYIQTPSFVVNQLASVFDTQCNLAGSVIGIGQGYAAVLQLKCITGEGPWHECFQYSDKCSGGPRGQVLGVIAPFQQQYIDETIAFASKHGNGMYMHSCHSGAYWYASYQKPQNGSITFPKTSIWNQFAIDGVTMRSAVSNWWRNSVDEFYNNPKNTKNTTVSKDVTTDCIWQQAPGRGTWLNDTARNNWGMSFCNPTCDGFPYYTEETWDQHVGQDFRVPTKTDDTAPPCWGGTMEWNEITGEDTRCLCGQSAGVWANASIDPSDKSWVIQLGTMSIGLDMCIDPVHCALSCGSPSTTPPPPSPTALQLGAGIQTQDCQENPVFCRFNQAQLILCDNALLMSDRANFTTPSNSSLPLPGYPFPVRETLHFNGLRILNASLTKLGQLGLSKAESVVLTGVGHGGTAAILHADRIGTILKSIAPSLQTFKLVVADSYHPRHKIDEFITINSTFDTANIYDQILHGVANVANAAAGMSAECKTKLGPAQQWRCLYINETMPYVRTPTFIVQQLASFWDCGCNLDGMILGLDQGRDAMMQLKCRKSMIWEICFQYTRRCTPQQVALAIAPFQAQYIRELEPFINKPKNGGFLHSCHLGGYWETAAQRWSDHQYLPPQPFKPQRPANWPAGFNTSSYWNQLAIGGTSMSQAVNRWWNEGEELSPSEKVFVDQIWPNKSWYPYINPSCNGWGWY